ncbi:hypothetical protein DY000_02032061 [Brassica cretica]|uniref:DUF4220 domain-containing protein n=1 Tax=Brassica cretica TaxID=69181 RepID=A0ABQ7DHF4_BRACR|nr:hypothetical protein DY000_02032061 [Brassica cretica]
MITKEKQGLQEVQVVLEEKMASPEDEEHLMETDEVNVHLLEHGIDMDAADDLPDFSDVETEEALMAYDEEAQPQEEEVQLLTGDGDGDDGAAENLGKNKTTRKRLFKPAPNTAGNTKMRNASALVHRASELQQRQSLITIVGILERGRYEMISGNMGLYLRQWYIYALSVRLQHLLHLVSLNQVQFQSRRRVLKLISMLGSNTLEKEDGEGLIRRLRDNRKERFLEGVRIWIVIHLALILCCNNNGEIFDWDETTTVLRAGIINDLWVSIILLVKYWNLVLQIGYGMGMCTGFLEQDVTIRLEFFGYTICCIVFVGIFMESMVRCWAEDKKRN